jgi:phage head maturation protease
MKLIDSIREKHKSGAGLNGDDHIGIAVSSIESLRMKDYGDTADSKPPVFSGVATNATIDMDDEVVVPEGLDWSYALKFGWMYPSHNYDELPIGSLNNVKLVDDGWFFSAVWVKRSQLSKDYYWIAKEFNKMGVSIGFKTLEAGKPTAEEVKKYGPHKTTIRRAMVLELSPTFMPCNPDAVANVKSGRSIVGDAQASAIERLVRLGKVEPKTYTLLTGRQLLTAGTRTIVVV